MSPQAATIVDRVFQIVRLRSIDELREYEALVGGVAGYVDVQAGVMFSIVECGGLVVGARDASGRLVGGALSILGLEDGRPYQHSEMMVVRPDLQGRGVGYQLKLAQRGFALASGCDLIVWTFDLLRPLNANLNLHKLGGIARRYEIDMYGRLPGFSAGLETDQLLVEWHLTSRRVVDRLGAARESRPSSHAVGSDAPVVTRLGREDSGGFASLSGYDLDHTEDRILVEVPDSGGSIRQTSGGLAREWRHGLREVFRAYLGRGYWVTDLLRTASGSAHRDFYVLQRPDSPELREIRHVAVWTER